MRLLKSVLFKLYSTNLIYEITKKVLTPATRAPFLDTLKTGHPRYPFFVVLTIDTEPGFIGQDELPIWASQKPNAFEGYTCGLRNWRELLEGFEIKGTFLLSTQFLAAKERIVRKIIEEIKLTKNNNHEIGSHLHPTLDKVLQNKSGLRKNYSCSRFYRVESIRKLLSAQRQLFLEYLGKEINDEIRSFRWGNWGLSTNAIKPLEENGYEIDSSAIPGMRAFVKGKLVSDWLNTKSAYPWKLSQHNYQNSKRQDSKILEIPITTFTNYSKYFRADPNTGPLLKAGFDYYYKYADRNKKPFVFVVISHSSEGTYKNGNKTKTLLLMDKFIKSIKKISDVEFITLQKAAKIAKVGFKNERRQS